MKSGRLASLDALRGFDMLFIMGGEQLVYAVAAALGRPDFKSCFGHVEWHGLQFMDIVFPLFLFMAGASFPFSCAKSRERGLGDGRIALRCLKRGVILVLLGLVCNKFLQFDFAHLRVWSVLGRIGVAWMIAAWMYLLLGDRDELDYDLHGPEGDRLPFRRVVPLRRVRLIAVCWLFLYFLHRKGVYLKV